MQNKDLSPSMEDFEGIGGAQAPSTDLVAILRGVLRRWKLVAAITLSVSIATYGVVKLIVPSRYKSTVEILVYDPQQQIDATVQKPISPFVDALGNDAITTEINILKSKSVALRVASELGLDTDPEFQPQAFESDILRNEASELIVCETAWNCGSTRTAWNCGSARTAWFRRLGPSL